MFRVVVVLLLAFSLPFSARGAIVLQSADAVTTSEIVHDIEDRMEPANPEPSENVRERLLRWADDKVNLAHRARVLRREQNRLEGTEIADLHVPAPVVVGNTSVLLIGAHYAETFAVGPYLIWLGNRAWMPGAVSWALVLGGGALAVPFPIPGLEWATEGLCLITLFVTSRPTFQKRLYRGELWVARKLGWVGNQTGLTAQIQSALERRTGVERLAAVGKGQQEFRLVTDEGAPLADLVVEPLPQGDVALRTFRLFDTGVAGRRELAQALRLFGSDIRDALLKPERLVAGRHGASLGEGVYSVVGNSVRLRGRTGLSSKGRQLCQAWLRGHGTLTP